MCERYINHLALIHFQLGTWPTTQACALAGNWTSNPSIHRLVLSLLSHTSWADALEIICYCLEQIKLKTNKTKHFRNILKYHGEAPSDQLCQNLLDWNLGTNIKKKKKVPEWFKYANMKLHNQDYQVWEPPVLHSKVILQLRKLRIFIHNL